MTEPHLKFNVSTGEFDCSGPKEYIDEKVKEFRELVLAIKQAQTAPAFDPMGMGGMDEFHFKRLGPKINTNPIEIEKDHQDIFSLTSGGDGIELRVLPEVGNGDAERQAYALLVLLWAFNRYLRHPDVLAMTLAGCLRRSGAGDINRLDRAANVLLAGNLITPSGQRAGKKYRLTTKGTAKAEELIKEMAAKLK